MDNIQLQNKKQGDYLMRQITSGDFVGFMLFVGQIGAGKKDSAHSFANAVLCESGDGEPCQMCASCKLVESGSHPDLIQLGGAGTIKIAEIRELQKKLYLKPYRAEHKVAIIEDAQMMTEESANALLKILEEPPENSVIILTAPDKTMLPETVVSRSQVVSFGASADSIKVFDAEISEDALIILNGQKSLPERFFAVHKYATDRKTASDLLDCLETNFRKSLLSGDSEGSDIKTLELIQKSREYLKSNLVGKFVLENLVLNMR